MDEERKARLERMGIKVNSMTQEEADSLPILIHPVKPPESPKKAVFIKRAKGQSFEDFKKAAIEAFRKKGMLKESPKITGGNGSSAENALVVNATSTKEGVSVENAYIESQCGKWDIDFTIDRQMQIDHNSRKYDLIYVTMRKDGSRREFWFDITSFFGKL